MDIFTCGSYWRVFYCVLVCVVILTGGDTNWKRRRNVGDLLLAIVKHIAVMHKAELKIESELGKGTEIKIVFPVQV